MLIAMQKPDATRVSPASANGRSWPAGTQGRARDPGYPAPHTFKVTDTRRDRRGDRTRLLPRGRCVRCWADRRRSASRATVRATDRRFSRGDVAAAGALRRLDRLDCRGGDTGNADGYAAPSEQRIRISDSLTEPNRRVHARTRADSRARLGYPESGARSQSADRNRCVLACRSLGLDTAGMSVPYVASWGSLTTWTR